MAAMNQQEIEELIAGQLEGRDMEQALGMADAGMQSGPDAWPAGAADDAEAQAEFPGQTRAGAEVTQPAAPAAKQQEIELVQTPFWMETLFVAARLIPLWAFLIALVAGVANGVQLMIASTRALVVLLVIGVACWGFTHYMSAFFAEHFPVVVGPVSTTTTQSWEA